MNKVSPLFTVATIAYNSGKWIRQAIESVLASSYADFEYIISDDCSTDDTWKIIQEFNDPRIKAWRNNNNIGEYPNRNKILREANGQYLLFVDGDDILYKRTLRNLSEYIKEFPNAASIWGVPSAQCWFALLPYQFEPLTSIKLIYYTNLNFSAIGFAETLFKIDILKNVGGFSDIFKIGDTWIKKRLAVEYPVLFVPMGFMLWRQSSNQASKKINSSYQGLLENFLIDLEIINILGNHQREIDKESLFKDLKSSFLKIILVKTFFKLKIPSFLKLFSASGLSWKDFRFILRKRSLKYLPITDNSMPLIYN